MAVNNAELGLLSNPGSFDNYKSQATIGAVKLSQKLSKHTSQRVS